VQFRGQYLLARPALQNRQQRGIVPVEDRVVAVQLEVKNADTAMSESSTASGPKRCPITLRQLSRKTAINPPPPRSMIDLRYSTALRPRAARRIVVGGRAVRRFREASPCACPSASGGWRNSSTFLRHSCRSSAEARPGICCPSTAASGDSAPMPRLASRSRNSRIASPRQPAVRSSKRGPRRCGKSRIHAGWCEAAPVYPHPATGRESAAPAG